MTDFYNNDIFSNAPKDKAVCTDISVENLERAMAFYSKLLNLEFLVHELKDIRFALCSHSNTENSLCLILEEDFLPFQHQPLLYLNVDGRLKQALEIVSAEGGKILSQERMDPYGIGAVIYDTEGNCLALYSR